MKTGDLNVLAKLTAGAITKSDLNDAILAFRLANANSLSQFNMNDGIIDEYQDESGIDTGSSINQSYDSVNDLYSPSGADIISASPFAHMALENNTDDGTGANAVTDIGTPTYTAPTGSSQPSLNNALTLDGSTDALNLNALEVDIDTDTTGSISAWVKFNSAGTIFSLGQTANTEYCLIDSQSGTKIQMEFAPSGAFAWRIRSSATLTTGTWYHFVIVQDGVSPKMYINGVEDTDVYVTNDTTKWFADLPNIDNGRLGCLNFAGSGNINFFDGQIDDFRYYQNKVLTSDEVSLLYNSGAGTEDQNPEGTPDNMTLISNSFPAQAEADNARIVILQEDVDSITINTDIIASVSRDDGTTFTPVTLIDEGLFDTNINLLSIEVDISGQPTGTDMIYKIETVNNKDMKIHGTGLSWD